ncbi:MAG: GtrA family protein [Patescibacteria group bacterium]
MQKYFRFVLMRGITFLSHLIILFFLTEKMNIYYQYSYLISTTLIMVINYVLGAKFVFKTKIENANPIHYFIITISLVYLSSWGLVFLKEIMQIHYIVASIMATISIMTLKFFLLKKLVFKSAAN